MELLFFQHFFECKFAGVNGQHFFDLREPFLQELLRPQTEGKFSASVEAPADQLQRDPPLFRIGFQ